MVVVANDDASTSDGVVQLDDSLHAQTFSTFPARMHEVQMRARRVLDPCLTRTIWMLGSQRRLLRLCEKLTVLP